MSGTKPMEREVIDLAIAWRQARKEDAQAFARADAALSDGIDRLLSNPNDTHYCSECERLQALIDADMEGAHARLDGKHEAECPYDGARGDTWKHSWRAQDWEVRAKEALRRLLAATNSLEGTSMEFDKAIRLAEAMKKASELL